jgi:murein L,D-transpeptidase YcbB/YkuD
MWHVRDSVRHLRPVLSTGQDSRIGFSEFTNAVIDGRDTALGAMSEAERSELHELYTPDYTSLWLTPSGRVTQNMREALAVLRQAADEGLDPADYYQDLLTLLMPCVEAAAPAPEDLARLDVAISAGMLRYLRDIHMGRIDPRTIGFRLAAPRDQHDFTALLRAALTEQRVTNLAVDLRPPLAQYRLLRAMLPRYRSLAADPTLAPPPSIPRGIHPGGTVAALRVPFAWRVRQIELALERLRWLPHLGDERLIALNIPMFRLWAWDMIPPNGAPRFGMDVIVGRALSTQTPVFAAEMGEVIFRPYWNVPRSILRHEVLPKLERDPDYLRREDMEVMRGGGDNASRVDLTAETLAGLRQNVLRVRQRPGPKNALGLIKFVFPNKDDVYMHGTPAQALFAKNRRDFSHGCVRVADPIALAEWVLQDLPEWTRDRILAATIGTQTVHVKLPRSVQVILFYTTAAVMPEDDTIRFAEDIYRHDARLDRALATRQVVQ